MNIMAETTINVTQYTCEKCGHKWIPRKKGKPKVCPVCKRMDWQEPKRK